MQAPSVIEGAVLIVLEFQPHSTDVYCTVSAMHHKATSPRR